MTEIEGLEIAVILLALGQLFHLLSHWVRARVAKDNEARFTHQYTAQDCPGRPCADGCDHRGLPPKEPK